MYDIFTYIWPKFMVNEMLVNRPYIEHLGIGTTTTCLSDLSKQIVALSCAKNPWPHKALGPLPSCCALWKMWVWNGALGISLLRRAWFEYP